MKFNLEQIKRKMLVKYPFFGGVIANIKYIETDEVKTAATDGINVYYNLSFFETLNKEEQTFVLSHETCHIAFDHIRRSEGKEHELWNIATDAVINANLERDGLKMPEGGVRVENALNYNSEELYEKLKEEQEALDQMSGQGQEGQPDQNQKGQSGCSQGNRSSDENEESQDQDQNSQMQSSSNSQKQDQKNKEKSQGKGISSQDGDKEENSQGSSSKGEEKNEKDKNNQSGGSSSNEGEDDKDKDEKSGGSSSKNKEKDKQNKDDNSVNGNKDKEANDEKEEGVDNSHKLWEEGLKKLKEQEKQEKENKVKDKNKNQNQNSKENNNDNNQKDSNDNNNNQSGEKNEKDAFEDNLEKRKQELQSLKEQLIEASKQAGLTTNAQDRTVDTTGYSKPIVDWRYILREAISQNVDWSLKNSYIEDGVVTYKLETYPTPETEIVLDTSGSVNETLLRNFLKECKNILQHSKVKVGCFDTQFYGFEELRREKDIDSLKFKGFGGTDFNAAVNAFSKRVENKIIFTDGYAPMPDKAINAIWLVYGEDEINPKGGKVIYITDEMLRELNQPKGKQKSLRR